MASTYSTNLAIELIGTGDQAGTWGITTNANLGTLIEQAISGYVTQAVSTGTDTTITIPNGATGVARNMYIELTGTGGASTNLIVPSNKKLYFVFNNTASGQVTVKVSGQTGVSVPNGAKMILVSNGTDIVDATNYVGNISAASGNITVLTSASATITNLLATSGSVSDLSATVSRAGSATLTNLTSTSGTVTTLVSNSATLTNLTSISATISTLKATSATINNFTFTSATVTRLAATSAVISDLSATVGRIGSATITNLIASDGSVTLTTAAVTSGNITTLTSASATITNLIATTATVTDLRATTVSATVSRAGSATITNLTATSASVTNLTATSATISNFTFTSATVTRLAATSATVSDLSATVSRMGSATVTNLIATSASITTLTNNPTFGAGTANGVLYLNGSKVATSGSGLTYNGSTLATTGALTVDGNATLGNASTDTVTVNGYVGVGGSANSTVGMYLQSSGLTGASQIGSYIKPVATSAATTYINGIIVNAGVADAAFTCNESAGVVIENAAKGASATITNQRGIRINDQTQGTNNYGITSLVSSGTNKWNIYASGTANNYFAGSVGIGTSSPSSLLHVSGTGGLQSRIENTGNTGSDSSRYIIKVGGTSAGDPYIDFLVNGGSEYSLGIDNSDSDKFKLSASGALGTGDLVTVTSAGNVGIGTSTPATKLDVNGAITSSGNLTVNGADVTITANIIHSGDSNTYFGFPSNDTFRIVTAGSEAMRVTSAGLVGIGTSSPATDLHIKNATDTQLLIESGTSSTGFLLFGDADDLNVGSVSYNHSDNSLRFETSDSERMRIDSAGNVGIGTSSPTQKLSVATASGNCYVDVARASKSTGQVALQLSGGTSGTNWIIYQPANSDNLTFFGNSSDRMVLDTSGNLGLGVTPVNASPIVNSFEFGQRGNLWATTGSTNIALSANGYLNASSAWTYKQTGTATAYQQDGSHKWFIAPSGTGGTAISFTQAMTLDTSGNLGIGTSSPAYPLQVRRAGGAGSVGITIDNVSGVADRTTQYFAVGDSTSDTTGHAFYTRVSTATDVLRLAITSVGNVGLSVTPAAWGSTWKALQISSWASLGAETSSTGECTLLQNAYASAASTFNYIGSFAATRYTLENSVHKWFTAPSGTAGNTITFTQAMTLTAAGNQLLGTTSETAGTRLKIVDTTPAIRLEESGGGSKRLDISVNASGEAVISAPQSAQIIAFSTVGSERARISAGGYFKASDNGTYTNSAGSYHEFRQSSQTEEGLILRTTNASYGGNSLLVAADRNTTNNSFYAFGYYNFAASAYKLRIADSGDVTNTNGTYGTISDAKMKTDIVDAGSQWADIKGLRFRKFKMKDDPSGLTQLGVVAQEVEQVSPGLVDEHADRDAEGNDLGTTTKSVKTSILLMKAAVALQEAMARIEQLEAKVAALESK